MSERFISVDVEASGPAPPDFSLLSIGACVVDATDLQFYVELQPMSDRYLPAALEASGLDLENLRINGTPPAEAMERFAEWVEGTAGSVEPTMVGLNASFDWAFVNWYFWHFMNHNPFGIGALDIKSMWMGKRGGGWRDSTSRTMAAKLGLPHEAAHNALKDAVFQAHLLAAMLDDYKRS